MCSLETPSTSEAPLPPAPIAAMLSFSLGGVCPGPPSTSRGTTVKAEAPAPAVFKKLRRERGLEEDVDESFAEASGEEGMVRCGRFRG